MPLQTDREELGDDGSPRKAHYGDGLQPWDHIVACGWAPEFAAGNVLKYKRRVKDPEYSRESAKWYYTQLRTLADQSVRAGIILAGLERLLTPEELASLQ